MGPLLSMAFGQNENIKSDNGQVNTHKKVTFCAYNQSKSMCSNV